MRLPLALLLSTLAAATTPAAIFAAYVQLESPERPGMAIMAFGVSFAVAFVHAVLLGLPAALVLVHKRAFGAIPMLIAGGLVGWLPGSLLFFVYSRPPDGSDYASMASMAFALGASGGLAFHAIFRLVEPRAPGGVDGHDRT